MAILAAFGVGMAGCEDTTPASLEPEAVPVRTVEVILPWESFGEELAVYGGFGLTAELFGSVLATEYQDVLNARVLVGFSEYPWSVPVRDSGGTTRVDSAFTFIGGRIVTRFDTLRGVPDEPVTVELGILQQEWEARTASWDVAVDTLNDFSSWGEPGAGPVQSMGQATWDPAEGDTLVLEVDSATVALLGDTLEAGPGVRLRMLTPGARTSVVESELRLYTRPNVNPDTVITLTAPARRLTFVYDPVPEPTGDRIRIGGAPSWRTVLRFDLPRTLDGPAELCARVECPFELTPRGLNNATLVLTTEASQGPFRPTDSLFVDARTVLSPEILPKSPLSSSLVGGLGISMPPEAFGDSAGIEVELPVTGFTRALLSGNEAVASFRSLALLTPIEPLGIGFGTFSGPGTANAPRLRLIVTVADTVVLP